MDLSGPGFDVKLKEKKERKDKNVILLVSPPKIRQDRTSRTNQHPIWGAHVQLLFPELLMVAPT
jgi:hypothetical protein